MIGDRIKQRREELHLSQEELAKRLGYKSRSSINKMELGIQDVPQRRMRDFAKALSCSIGYLLEDDLYQPKAPEVLPVPDLSGLKKIPVLGLSACGSPIEAVREWDYIEVEKATGADFALIAEGKSMTGCGIMDGSMVLFRETSIVDNGQIAAVTVENATTIKRFYRYGDSVVLRACNPDFDDQEYRGDELTMVHVFGKAVACLTGL